jgi:hypothetical protein
MEQQTVFQIAPSVNGTTNGISDGSFLANFTDSFLLSETH